MKLSVSIKKNIDRFSADVAKRQAEAEKKPSNSFGSRLEKYKPALIAAFFLVVGLVFSGQ